MEILQWINENIIWGIPALLLFAGSGIIFTIRTRGMQILKFPTIIKRTLLTKQPESDGKKVSPFRTLTAALGATVGTGNIIAIGSAIAIGGPGAIFWMWISALLGMATSFAENYLGAKYRTVQPDGLTGGVPFAYIKKAFGGKKLGTFFAAMFAVCCIGASFGIGNMAQINSASMALERCLNVPLWVTGIICAVVIALIAPGGIHRLSKITAWLIPIASGGYLLGCLAVIIMNYDKVPEVFVSIFSEAFSLKSVSGGTVGIVMLEAMKWGVKRGVFSNEAGLGSSVMINANSSAEHHHTQGMWAMLSVFIDTIIICTMTALCILTSGADKLSSTGFDMALIAFEDGLGSFAGAFLSIATFIFALTTVTGWWIYGRSCFVYLFSKKWVGVYLAIFVITAFVGAVIQAQVVWDVSDLFNGLMAIPNLVAIILLRKEVKADI